MPRTTSSMQTAESLEEIAKELQRQAISLLGVKEMMQECKCPALRIDAYSSLTDGMKRTQIFIGNAVDAMRVWREGNGNFRADKKGKPK